MLSIRKETSEDLPAISRLITEAFNQPNESRLVNRLRRSGNLACSLVAVEHNRIVGYLAMSPVSITQDSRVFHSLGLGPVAVTPSAQNRGIGKQLIKFWLANLAQKKDNLVVVLGHAEYYPKFGFKPSRPFGIQWEHDAREENFMVLEIRPGALKEISGVVRYHNAFMQA